MKLTIHTPLILLISLIQPAQAQLDWHGGEATLCTGITVRGELCYQPNANVLLFRTADKWRAYTASQLQSFHYIELKTSFQHWYTVYPVGREATPFIFEELIHRFDVRLLHLSGVQAVRLAEMHGLPKLQKTTWRSPQPWYVWFDGQFMTPDVFVTTGLDELVVAWPESVQQWINSRPRPETPKALARWLQKLNERLAQAKPVLEAGQPLLLYQYTPPPLDPLNVEIRIASANRRDYFH